jgi:hypothetical protein
MIKTFIIVMIAFSLGFWLHLTNQPSTPEFTPVNIKAITMPDNCFEQLSNAKMIQIKIIKE